MINIDMWYGDKAEDITKIDISFSDIDCVYRGNCYIDDKIVGDYNTNNSLDLEDAFPQLKLIW